MTIYEHTFKKPKGENMQYAVFKLMNGDEIIAKLIDQDKKTVKLYDPVQIHRVMTPVGNEMIRCSYWMLFNKSPEVTLDRSIIITYAEDVNNNVVKHYEFFLKHANKKDLDENLGEIIEEAEEEFKKHMIGRESREDRDKENLLMTPANTTIH